MAQTIARLPRTVEFVLMVNDARLMFDSPVGLAMWNIVTDLDVGKPGEVPKTAEVRKAWDDLADQLGWPRPETLDRLIGSRLMLVVRDLESDANRRWAVVSAVSEQTDLQLKTQLRPAARKIVDGHPILSIEQGKYEVTSHLNAPGPARPVEDGARNIPANLPLPADGRSVSLLLTESDKTELFDELIGIFSRRAPDSLADTEVPRETEKLGRAGVFIALRIDPEDGVKQDPADLWRNFLLIAARRTATGWECSFMLRDSEFEGQLAQVPETSDAPMRALTKDSLVAVLETRLKSIKPNPSNPVERLFSMLGLPDEIQKLLSGRQLLVIRSTTPDAVPQPGAPAPDTRLSITMGAETTDVPALGPPGDAFMEDSLLALEDRLQLPRPVGRPNMNLGGIAPAAIRKAQLDVPNTHLLARFFLVPLRFAWTFSFPPRGQQPVPVPPQPNARKNMQDKSPAGWWLVNVGQPDSLMAIAKSLRDPDPGGEVRHWYSLGIIRPARCVPFFSNILPDLNGWQAALGRIDSVQWSLAVSPDKDVEGTMTIEMTTPK